MGCAYLRCLAKLAELPAKCLRLLPNLLNVCIILDIEVEVVMTRRRLLCSEQSDELAERCVEGKRCTCCRDCDNVIRQVRDIVGRKVFLAQSVRLREGMIDFTGAWIH